MSRKLNLSNYYGTLTIRQDSDGQFHLDLKNYDGMSSLPISQALAQQLFTECSPSDPSHYHYDDRSFFDVFRADEDERVGPDDSETRQAFRGLVEDRDECCYTNEELDQLIAYWAPKGAR